MTVAGVHRKKGQASAKHAYLSGNFAPIHRTSPLTPCTYVGTIPQELVGGEYVRNGGNPVSNEDLGRDAHWFDGDGMLSGVSFNKDDQGNTIPEFVNQFVLTDVFLSTVSSPHVRTPILPSITTLVNPVATLLAITVRIMRTIFLVVLSFLPGSSQAIKRISVANTSIWYHDGRALAGCESGPPMRVQLPGLETVGWYDGAQAQNEPQEECAQDQSTIGGQGLIGFMREWTTAHPKVDPDTKEMLLFHSTFLPPYIQYSVIPETQSEKAEGLPRKKYVNLPLPGVSSAKMMHDFGVSSTHSVILDLPLSLDPLNLIKNRPVVEYDPSKPSRFGVFPRHNPELVRWFETKACCIFHTANTWDGHGSRGQVDSVHMLACRLTSPSPVFSAGNIAAPPSKGSTYDTKKVNMSFFAKYEGDWQALGDSVTPGLDLPGAFLSDEDIEARPLIRHSVPATLRNKANSFSSAEHPFELPEEIWEEWTDSEEDQCRLYYYNFCLATGTITSQYALARIPFEFPSVSPNVEMKAARYVYGCSTSCASFGAALGKSAKIDVLVKMDVQQLIAKGERQVADGIITSLSDCVDRRTIAQVVDSRVEDDAINVFQMPMGWFAQEPRFVPRRDGKGEDDGYLLTYAFNEAQLDIEGEVPDDNNDNKRAKSELWIIDAKDMRTVIGRVKLPQRVPYGLHGQWFSEEEISGQRKVEAIRTVDHVMGDRATGAWMSTRTAMEKLLA